jgi:predicted enzyme related to lactoylglutathione lyase
LERLIFIKGSDSGGLEHMGDFNGEKNRVVWFDIPVADLDRAGRFYSAVLGVRVDKETFGDFSFCVIEHKDGNGGCLVPEPADITGGGVLIYLNVNGRIHDAVAKVVPHGGTVLNPSHAIGTHGFRAIILDSEGNRVALHSMTDQ